MKIMQIILSVFLVGAVSLSWFQFTGSIASEQINYRKCLKCAEESYEKGLYEEAIEYYKNALSHKDNAKIYDKINEACEKFYEEENTQYVRNFYIDNILEVIDAVPEEPSYWIKAINLYKEKNDYASAYNVVKKAKKNGIENDEINSIYLELKYMTKIDSHSYDEYKTALNGYVSVYDSNGWQVTNNLGNIISRDYYNFIGLINDDGTGMYINSIDMRIIDRYNVTRARFKFNASEAGIYSSETDYTPVLVDNEWRYVNSDGQFLSGKYQTAGCFKNGKAAVKRDNNWYLIDDKGKKVSDDYEEIKLDLHGSYLQGDVILAKSGGSYSIYDSSFKKVSDFSCEDFDVCLNNNLIAYKKDGKWGFVDTKGKVVIEPTYQKAKSFSNGMAAVCSNNKWGFINDSNQLVIDYQFADASYFNSDNYCIISQGEGKYQFMYLLFE